MVHSQLRGRGSRRSPGGPAAAEPAAAETGSAADSWSCGSFSSPGQAAGRGEETKKKKGGLREQELAAQKTREEATAGGRTSPGPPAACRSSPFCFWVSQSVIRSDSLFHSVLSEAAPSRLRCLLAGERGC